MTANKYCSRNLNKQFILITHLDSVLFVLAGVQDGELETRLHLGLSLVGEVDTEVTRGLWSVSLGVELHFPVSALVVVDPTDGELAGPEKLGVAFRPFAESLNGPGEGVFRVVTDLGPSNNSRYHHLSLCCSDTYLHQDSLSMGGRIGDSSSSLWFILDQF